MDKNGNSQEIAELCNVLATIDNADDVKRFLEDLCTIREMQDFAQRLSVAQMLDAGHAYTSISDATGASATTIARVSKCLNYGSGGYRMVLDQILGNPDPDGEDES